MKHIKLFEQVEDWDWDPFGEDDLGGPDILVGNYVQLIDPYNAFYKNGDNDDFENLNKIAMVEREYTFETYSITGGVKCFLVRFGKDLHWYREKNLKKVDRENEQYNWDDDPFGEDFVTDEIETGDTVELINSKKCMLTDSPGLWFFVDDIKNLGKTGFVYHIHKFSRLASKCASIKFGNSSTEWYSVDCLKKIK